MSTPLEQTHEAVRRFLAAARQPAVIEAGSEPIALAPDNYLIEFAAGRLTLQAWDTSRNLVRRITDVAEEKPGNVKLVIERFGKKTGTIDLVDLSRPRGGVLTKRAARLTYAEQFRRSLLRQFPGWQLAAVSSEPDLEHSLSPAYPRALLRKGTTGWAAIGASEDSLDPDGILTFGLIWLDYLRARERRLAIEGLALFLPEGRHLPTCLRLQHLRKDAAQWVVYIHGDGFEERVDLRNSGNLQTVLPVRGTTPAQADTRSWVSELLSVPGVVATERPGGETSLRVRGLEFAYTAGPKLLFGIDGKRQARFVSEIEAVAQELTRLRSPGAPDRHNPLYTRYPELWLEAEVRKGINIIDAGLQPAPIYGQVPAFAGGERSIIDLLAVDYRGRLAVVELKASEDLHLPLQSLDYWMRVRHHAEHGEFTPKGYFPGTALLAEPPRLLLVAPALAFHPSTETILRYFPSDLDIVRVGLGAEWRGELNVVFRAEGAMRPDDERRSFQ